MKQKNEKESIGIQIKEINIDNRMNKNDIENMIKSMFWDNFLVMRDESKRIVEERLQEFSERFIERVLSSSSIEISKFKNPDVQYNLYKSQEAYVRTESESKHRIITDLIINRITTSEESNLQLNLNEAIEVIPKLNERLINNLTLLFIMRETECEELKGIKLSKDKETLTKYLKENVMPFVNDTIQRNELRYLVYCGCGNLLAGPNFSDSLVEKYPQTFEIIGEKRAHLNPKDNYCIRINNSSFNIRDYICSLDSEFEKIFRIYDDRELCRLKITSVAALIAMYNLRVKIGKSINIEKYFI